jgi:hypothetical protein
MTQCSARATRQHCCHPASVAGQLGSANRVDAAMHRVQATLLDPVMDRTGAESVCEELASRDDTMLPLREGPNRPRLQLCLTHRPFKAAAAQDSPGSASRRCACRDRGRGLVTDRGRAGTVRVLI